MKRRNMQARILAALLSLTLLGTAVGCSGNEPAETTRAAESAAKAAAAQTTAAAKVDKETTESAPAMEKIKLKGVVLTGDMTGDVNQMQWMVDAMEKANVEIEWRQVGSDWQGIKGNLFGSGDIPDILMGSGIATAEDLSTFKGLFKDLSPYLEEAPNIQKMFSEKPETRVMITNESGEIYALPKYQWFYPASWLRHYINKDWLDKLGLEVPETWDDLYVVLKAFKEQDPNGNGKADEIPYSFQEMQNAGIVLPYALMTGQEITLDMMISGYGFYADDGQVKNFLGSQEFKEFSEFCHKLYSEGLIHSAAFTQEESAYLAAARQGEENNEATYGFFTAWTASYLVGEKLAEQYISIAPIKAGPDKEASWTYEFENLNFKPITALVSEKCREPEAAVRFLDALYDRETSISSMFGDVGKYVTKNADGSYTVLTPAEAGDTEGLDPNAWCYKVSMKDFSPGYLDDEIEIDLPSDMAYILDHQAAVEEALGKVDLEKDTLHRTFLKLTEDELKQMALIQTNIASLATPQFTQFVVNGGIDEGWDAYVKALEGTGVEEGIKIYQRAFDEFIKSKNE